MHNAGKTEQTTNTKWKAAWKTLSGHFPKAHVLLLGGLATGLTLLTAIPSEDASASRQSQPVELPVIQDVPLKDISLSSAEASVTSFTSPAVANAKRVEQTVKSGDSLSTIFARAGLKDRDMLELVHSSDAAKQLARLYPGHRLVFEIDADGKLQTLEYVKDRLNSHIFSRSDAGFIDQPKVLEPDVQLATRQATIENSLFLAGMKVQLNDRMIMDLANIFGWDIDFALDIRKGDNFKVLFEETFLDGEKIGNGDILAAEFTNQDRTYRAVRYTDSNGETHYYTPTGDSMRKAFLRAPLDFRRISSNFNPKRLHPIHKTVRPHRGTDYAANRGTPVWSAGDGRVIESGYTRPNGNYIIIQHGNGIQTKYLHLDKRYVKKGERVRQRETIGTVGSTGYSTAPHLHYEFVLNGVHRNPRTILQKLPKAESVAENELQRFYAATQPLLAALDGESNTKFAAAEPADIMPTL